MNERSAHQYRLAVDVGGTFTDLVLAGAGDGWRTYKTSSTPEDPSNAVIEGLGMVAADLGIALEELLDRTPVIVHGMTITTNALLTRTGAHTAFLTTQGFRDIVGLRRGHRDAQFDSRTPPPEPLVPRSLVMGVGGRIDRTGQEREPLDEPQIRAVAASLREEGIESVAVALMFSFLDAGHERRVAEILGEELPGVPVTISSAVSPEVRLYERSSTAVVNAYVSPVLRRYLARLLDRLAQLRFGGTLLVMQSNGGVATAELAAEQAVSTLLSGPAGGPVASARTLEALALPKSMTIDMGGTSFEASLALGGETALRAGGTLDGHAISTPMLDIATIGAGGGSIAWVTPGGMLRVGPQSAGAVPGPACYARGGSAPTVTDASLVLGYLDPDGLAGSGVTLSRELAEAAIATVAEQVGLSVIETAAGIHTAVNAAMADSLRLLTVSRGYDPREFALVAAGGAGPIHAVALARDLEIPLVIVPREAAVLCAAGMLGTDFSHHDVRTVFGRIPPIEAAGMEQLFLTMEAGAAAQFAREGVTAENTHFRRSAEVRYVGQVHQIEIDFPADTAIDATALANLYARFHPLHDERFGHRLDEIALEIVNLRLEARGRAGSVPPPFARGHDDTLPEPWGQREAWFDGGFVPTDVYDTERLNPGVTIVGPALVEATGSTIVIPPAYALTVDLAGSYVLHGATETLDEVAARLNAGGVRV